MSCAGGVAADIVPRVTRRSSLVGALMLLCASSAHAAAQPDLRVGGVTAQVAGQSLVVRATIANANGTARGSTARILLSNDARADRSDTKLAELRTKRLGRRKKVHLSRTLVLPAVTGARRVLVCADVRRRVHERNERNNCAASGAVTLSRPADLQPPGTPPRPPETPRRPTSLRPPTRRRPPPC